jgi:O-antigen/teichoic acid export membrane protein
VTGKIPGIANTLGATMFPTASRLDGEKSASRIEVLYVRSFRLITITAAALCVTAIAFAYKILLYWLNADFAAHSWHILIILAFTNFILALLGPLSNFLLGLGKLKFLTGMSLAMGVLNAILLLILLPRYGITGAAWAYLLSVLPAAYMFYHTEKRYLALSGRKRYYARKIGGTIVTSLIVWAADAYLLSPLVISLPTLLLMGMVSMLLYLILYKWLGFFEAEDWRDIERFCLEAAKRLRGIADGMLKRNISA